MTPHNATCYRPGDSIAGPTCPCGTSLVTPVGMSAGVSLEARERLRETRAEAPGASVYRCQDFTGAAKFKVSTLPRVTKGVPRCSSVGRASCCLGEVAGSIPAIGFVHLGQYPHAEPFLCRFWLVTETQNKTAVDRPCGPLEMLSRPEETDEDHAGKTSRGELQRRWLRSTTALGQDRYGRGGVPTNASRNSARWTAAAPRTGNSPVDASPGVLVA